MKQRYAIVLLVLIFASTLSVAQVTVKFQKPASWTAVSLYAWKDATPEPLGGWPGAALTETDGWYTYTFDATFAGANLIFNNVGAGEQTVDYYTAADVCLKASDVLNAGGKYDVSVVPCTAPGMTVKFKKPASWTAVSLYTYGPEVTGGWPGAALTETDGWYTFTFDATYTGGNLIFNNAGSGEQTEDYVMSTDVCLEAASVLNANTKYDVAVVDCSPAVGMTVKFQKPASWTVVSLYTYGPEVTGGWPGAVLTETGGWYTYTFDAAYTGGNLIFNNAGAGEQTEDFVISTDVCLKAASVLNANSKYDIAVTSCTLPGFTATFKKPETWTNVNIYAYVSGNSIVGGWPGIALTETDGVYSYTFDAMYTSVIIIYNNGTVQLPDTEITSSTCLQSTDGTTIQAVDCSTITAINAVKETSFAVYPNPVADKLNFNAYNTIERVNICSLTGKNALTNARLSENGVMDVKTLKSGVYFVTVFYANGKQEVRKIIKK